MYPGTDLSLALTDSGTSHFWRWLGPDVGVVRGTLLTTDSQAFSVSVRSVGLRHGEDLSWKGESVQLPQQYVAYLEERRISKPRTFLAVGGSIAALVALIVTFDITGSTGDGSVGGGGGGRR